MPLGIFIFQKKITLTKRRLGGTEVKLMVQKTQ